MGLAHNLQPIQNLLRLREEHPWREMETSPDVSEFSLTHNPASMWYLCSDRNELLFIPSLPAQPFLIHTPLNPGQKGLAGECAL